MKQLILSKDEEETLRELLDEEIEETKKCEVNVETMSYLSNLKCIKNKLNDNSLSSEVKLGIKIGQLKDRYGFNDIYNFITGKTKDCYCFVNLKPLYDEFGYSTVNEVILAVGKEMFEVKEDEQESISK